MNKTLSESMRNILNQVQLNESDPNEPLEKILAEYYEPWADEMYDVNVDSGKHRAGQWILNETYSIVNGKVNIIAGLKNGVGYCKLKKSSTKLLLPFGFCDGDFYCADVGLDSLEGAPNSVNSVTQGDGNFSCTENYLHSLKGGPVSVDGEYTASDNPLESLDGIDSNSKINLFYITYNAYLPLLRALCVKEIYFVKYGRYQLEVDDLRNIINYHIRTYSNLKERIIKCQYAMIKSGYKDNAKW